MPTLKDVAKIAGVTVTTVSRVLNDRGYISDETRTRVYEAIDELDYQPNEIARSLSRKKSNIIGLIIPTVEHAFFGSLSFHLEYYAYKKGFKVMICNSQLEHDKEKDYINMLRGHQVDGIIMGSHTFDVEDYTNLNLPIVTFDRKIDNIPYVSSDNYRGGHLATELLIKKGCKKIALLGGNLKLNLLANKRFEAFRDVVQKSNIEHVIIQSDINSVNTEQYEDLVTKALRENPDLDGIFATSDIIAANVIKICHNFNKRVPEDIKIVGYDDLSIASLTVPQITTIKQPIKEMAELAIDLLSKQVEDKMVPVANVLPVKLIERGTT